MVEAERDPDVVRGLDHERRRESSAEFIQRREGPMSDEASDGRFIDGPFGRGRCKPGRAGLADTGHLFGRFGDKAGGDAQGRDDDRIGAVAHVCRPSQKLSKHQADAPKKFREWHYICVVGSQEISF
ncbi:MAG: hypothetical protein IPK39_20230 [Sulfuritalea sp.]|nr:hypothetical protein [Sulfuritalea sp.]